MYSLRHITRGAVPEFRYSGAPDVRQYKTVEDALTRARSEYGYDHRREELRVREVDGRLIAGNSERDCCEIVDVGGGPGFRRDSGRALPL